MKQMEREERNARMQKEIAFCVAGNRREHEGGAGMTFEESRRGLGDGDRRSQEEVQNGHAAF
jgi:hypothetical protein